MTGAAAQSRVVWLVETSELMLPEGPSLLSCGPGGQPLQLPTRVLEGQRRDSGAAPQTMARRAAAPLAGEAWPAGHCRQVPGWPGARLGSEKRQVLEFALVTKEWAGGGAGGEAGKHKPAAGRDRSFGAGEGRGGRGRLIK